MSEPGEILPIVPAGTPVLRQPTRRVELAELPGLQGLLAQMAATMRAAPGVGLAAPQVGRGLALAVIEDRADYQARVPAERLASMERAPVALHALVNPVLVPDAAAGEVELWEGCLSVPGYMGLVRRFRQVRVEALDATGAPCAIEARGWYARILQHEIDHLAGVLYLDRLTPRTLCEARLWAEVWADRPVSEARRTLGA